MPRNLGRIVCACATLVAVVRIASAEDQDRTVMRAIAVQKALDEGRRLLFQNEPKRAIEILEPHIPFINGNRAFLAVLRDAYWAHLKELQKTRRDDEIPGCLKKLRLLDPKAEMDGHPAPAAGTRPIVARGKADEAPVEPAVAADSLAKAEEAFEQKRYTDADALYRRVDPSALGESRPRWAYCRLWVTMDRLRRPLPVAQLEGVEEELNQAVALAGNRAELVAFAEKVRAELRSQKADGVQHQPAGADGWTQAESTNFRLFHQQPREMAGRVLQAAEAARTAAFALWVGGTPAPWAAKCDLYLHATAAECGRATNQPASPGHATMQLRGGAVASRRVDLAADNLGLTTTTIPHEVAHVVLADQFPDKPLPRWADEAMAVLCEPRANVDRYLKMVPRLLQDRKLLAVGQLMRMDDYPEVATVTAFYVESVSLVDYLVATHGAAKFIEFLRVAQRYGYESALERTYQIGGFKEFQDRWLQSLAK